MIYVNGLSKIFGDFTAVDGLTFQVNDGEIFSLLGLNGPGKTTTIRMLSCLISKTSRDARIDDLSISNKEDSIKTVIQGPEYWLDYPEEAIDCARSMEVHWIMQYLIVWRAKRKIKDQFPSYGINMGQSFGING